jgi:hypothetical protein
MNTFFESFPGAGPGEQVTAKSVSDKICFEINGERVCLFRGQLMFSALG